MPSYDLPTNSVINASAGLLPILLYVNNATFGWFSRLLLIGILLVVTMAYYKAKDDLIGGFAISGFAVFVIAFLFFIAGFVNGLDLGFALGIMLIGVTWVLVDKQGTA